VPRYIANISLERKNERVKDEESRSNEGLKVIRELACMIWVKVQETGLQQTGEVSQKVDSSNKVIHIEISD